MWDERLINEWSTDLNCVAEHSNHSVSQPIPMQRRPGSFPGNENNCGLLSPKSAENLGLKLVNYILEDSSPSVKELENRLKNVKLNYNGQDDNKNPSLVNYNDLNKDSNHQKELLNNELQLHQQRLLQQQQQQQQQLQQQQNKTSPSRQNNQSDNQSSNNTFNTSSNNGFNSNYDNGIDASAIIDSIPFDYSSHLMNQQGQQQHGQQNQQNNIDSSMSNSYDV